MTTDAAARSVRTRRTGEEIRSLLVAAGREVFSERGYADASTKEIARQADVTEVLLFRHFANKAGLFDEVVLGTFEGFIEEYAPLWARHSDVESTYEISREYIDHLYSFFEQNRTLIVALLAARSHHPSATARLDELFARLEDIVREAIAEYEFIRRDSPGITVRLTFGMVLSAAIHGETILPAHSAITRDELIDELTKYMMHGIGDER